MAIFGGHIKKTIKKLAKLLQRMKNRLMARRMWTALQHTAETTRVRKQQESWRDRARPPQRGHSRGKERKRGPDRAIKRNAQEEQLWKLKSANMREKVRGRKKDAMNRWSNTATSGGAFRGV